MSGGYLDNKTEGELIALAAQGSHDAQLHMTVLCMAKQFCGLNVFEAMALAEPFARMLASHGRPEDILLLAGVLHSRSVDVRAFDPVRADRLASEVSELFDHVSVAFGPDGRELLVTLLTALADDGDEDAAIRLNRFMDLVPADEVAKLNATVRHQVREVVAMMGGGNA